MPSWMETKQKVAKLEKEVEDTQKALADMQNALADMQKALADTNKRAEEEKEVNQAAIRSIEMKINKLIGSNCRCDPPLLPYICNQCMLNA